MKLADRKDANGTSMQAYADLLAEKILEHGLTYVILIIEKEPPSLHTLSNVDMAALPNALKELAHRMRKPPKGDATVNDLPEN